MANIKPRHMFRPLPTSFNVSKRCFAHIIPGVPIMPSPPPDVAPITPDPSCRSQLDKYLLYKALDISSTTSDAYRGPIFASSSRLLDQYSENRGKELRAFLAMESKPTKERRVDIHDSKCPVSLIAYVSGVGQISEANAKVCVGSGFKLNVDEGLDSEYWLSCAHTLEDAAHRGPQLSSTTAVGLIMDSDGNVQQIGGIPSSLPRQDLILASKTLSKRQRRVDTQDIQANSLPVSPYPLPIGAAVAAHFIVDKESLQKMENEDGWIPCFNGMMYQKWVKGHVAGYRDFAGNESKPGTYDSLAHMFITPIPTPGSSGGPIIDLESGSVVGVIRGSRMDNRISGLKGWATSAESVYEMFRLPGLQLQK